MRAFYVHPKGEDKIESFAFGQRHVVELEEVQKIADFAQVRFDVVSLEPKWSKCSI